VCEGQRGGQQEIMLRDDVKRGSFYSAGCCKLFAVWSLCSDGPSHTSCRAPPFHPPLAAYAHTAVSPATLLVPEKTKQQHCMGEAFAVPWGSTSQSDLEPLSLAMTNPFSTFLV
jgi:hypothetical protein